MLVKWFEMDVLVNLRILIDVHPVAFCLFLQLLSRLHFLHLEKKEKRRKEKEKKTATTLLFKKKKKKKNSMQREREREREDSPTVHTAD